MAEKAEKNKRGFAPHMSYSQHSLHNSHQRLGQPLVPAEHQCLQRFYMAYIIGRTSSGTSRKRESSRRQPDFSSSFFPSGVVFTGSCLSSVVVVAGSCSFFAVVAAGSSLVSLVDVAETCCFSVVVAGVSACLDVMFAGSSGCRLAQARASTYR